jgi:hypothetical protein
MRTLQQKKKPYFEEIGKKFLMYLEKIHLEGMDQKNLKI